MVVRIWWTDFADLPWLARNIEEVLKNAWARVVRVTSSFIELTATPKLGADDDYLHKCIFHEHFVEERS